MAHEIEKNDSMFSVREVPWHGLGNVIEETPTIEEAIVASGLDWKASLCKMQVETDAGEIIKVPDQFAIMRNDTQDILGTVGNRYQIYQNSEMWDFIDTFQKQSGIKLETAGSLKNGRTTWVLAKNGCMEAVSGDPIEEYFLFRNGFDGWSTISALFTNIRVVCNNTLSAALRGSKNIFNVRHTKSAGDQLAQVQQALGIRSKYQTKLSEALDTLAKKDMSATDTERFLENVIFPLPTKNVQIVGEDDTVAPEATVSKNARTQRANKIEAVTNLIETGAGADIAGVRGTAYGLYNALTEWADHEKIVRITQGKTREEARFENAFYGTGAQFKQESFKSLLKLAA